MSRWNIRPLAVFGTAAVTSLAASMLMASSAANADSVWYQAYERTSQDATCTAPAGETPWQSTFSGQQEWTPSWQQWANGGKGGWVCQREIVWAKSEPEGGGDAPASGLFSGCVPSEDEEYVKVVDGFAEGPSPDESYLYEQGCLSPVGGEPWPNAIVYAADAETAELMCNMRSPGYYARNLSEIYQDPGADDSLYECIESD